MNIFQRFPKNCPSMLEILLCVCVAANAALCQTKEAEPTQKKPKMKPEESLVLKIEELPIPDDSPDLLSRGPWVRLSVLNKSPNRWYYDMEAQDHGLRLIVADNDDNAVPLNQVGKNKALFKSLDNSRRRIGVFRSEYAATVDIGLADYCKLVPGRSYSVIVEWALNVHDIRPPRKPLEEEWTHRITLKSESIVVKKAAK